MTTLLMLGFMIVAADPLHSLPALHAALANAKAGDRIELAAGTYEGSIQVDRLRGTKDRPIIIAGADAARPPVIRGSTNGAHLRAPAYVVIEHFVFESATGNGVNIDDAGDLAHPAPGVTLRNLVVRDIGPKGNCDGIKLSGLTDFLVENCTIERWGSDGSGIDMVGCADGLVQGCTLVHTNTGGANGVQLKGGTRNVTVRCCRFENAGRRALNIGGSTGLQYFRPEPRGFEAADIIVEGCTIVGSDAAVAFVGIDGAEFRFNTVYHPERWALRILQETRTPGFVFCRNGRFEDNLVVIEKRAIHAANIGDMTDGASFVFARNAWYWEGEPEMRPTLPAAESDGQYGTDPEFRNVAGGDLSPAAGVAANVGAHAFKKVAR